MTSWDYEINNHAAKVAAIHTNPGHLDGIVRKFTSPGYAYALALLQASPKQIREANHLMLSQGYCYLRLFAVKYRREIAQWLGRLPTYERVEQQLCAHSIPTRRLLCHRLHLGPISGPHRQIQEGKPLPPWNPPETERRSPN